MGLIDEKGNSGRGGLFRFAFADVPVFPQCLIGYADTAGFADSDWLVGKITDLTDLLEFGALTKLLDFYGGLLSLIPQSRETVFASKFVPGGLMAAAH
jgi:hypothetical protein